MLGEAITRGINSHAAMLAGPTANPETWGYRRMSALAGRINAAWLDDCRDEQHPNWVVGTWEILARDHLNQPRDYDPTLTEASNYLDNQLHHLAQDEEFDFASLAQDLRDCARHLEEVLRDGTRPQTGATCPSCGRADLEKHYGNTEAEDRWTCPRCAQQWTEHDYRIRIGAIYIGVAPALTASQIRQAYRIPEATVRKWAQRGRVTKRGTDNDGRMLYDVADVIACRDEPATA
jgi:transposase-like protein